jgi:hypothetical protein
MKTHVGVVNQGRSFGLVVEVPVAKDWSAKDAESSFIDCVSCVSELRGLGLKS